MDPLQTIESPVINSGKSYKKGGRGEGEKGGRGKGRGLNGAIIF